MAGLSEINKAWSNDGLNSIGIGSLAQEQAGMRIFDAYQFGSQFSSSFDSNVLLSASQFSSTDSLQGKLPPLQIVEDRAIGQDIKEALSKHRGALDGRVKIVGSGAELNDKPNFIVHENGSIKMEINPDTDSSAVTIIKVATGDGAKQLTPAQRLSLGVLVDYFQQRLQERQPEDELLVEKAFTKAAPAGGVEQTPLDNYGSIVGDPNLSRNSQDSFSQEPGTSMQSREQVADSISGSSTPEPVDSFFPKREGGVLKGESQSVYHLKNAISGLFNPDKDRPYETLRSVGDGSAFKELAVGRYGLRAQDFLEWLEIEDLNNLTPEQLATKIAKLVKEGKLPKELATKLSDRDFALKFIGTLQKMAKGDSIEASELKEIMPPALQEAVAADVVDRNLKVANGDTGKAALAMKLGKSPAELSQQDLNDSGNKFYMRAARQLENISQATEAQNTQSGDSLSNIVTPDGNCMRSKIARAGKQQAAAMDSTNRCAEGVQLALSKVGMDEYLSSGHGWEMHKAFLNNPKWRVTTNPREASICFRDWSPEVKRERGAAYGHVALLYTDPKTKVLKEVSDHEAPHEVNNPRYSKTIYLAYVG